MGCAADVAPHTGLADIVNNHYWCAAAGYVDNILHFDFQNLIK
jgi:hypothetical protein